MRARELREKQLGTGGREGDRRGGERIRKKEGGGVSEAARRQEGG